MVPRLALATLLCLPTPGPPDTSTTLGFVEEACSTAHLDPTDFATLEVCAGAVSNIPAERRAEALLAQARLFQAFPIARCGRSSHPACSPVREFVSEHPELFAVKGRTVVYTGWHYEELARLYPHPGVLPSGRCMVELMAPNARGWESEPCRDYLASATARPCPPGTEAGKGGASVEEFAGCEVTARRAGEEAGPLLVQLGRMCRRFPGGCGGGACAAFIGARPDLFGWYEIHGVQCHRAIFEEVTALWPRSLAADDAAWESASWLGGECEGFIDCYLENGRRPFDRYRAQFPAGRNLPLAVDRMVESLTGNLEGALQGGAWAEPGEIKRVLRTYESSTAGLPAHLRRRVLVALEPYWKGYGDVAHARALRAVIVELNGQ